MALVFESVIDRVTTINLIDMSDRTLNRISWPFEIMQFCLCRRRKLHGDGSGTAII